MALVHRSVTITAEQDAFLLSLEKDAGVRPSEGVRMALRKLMHDPPVFLSPRNTTESSRVSTVRGDEEQAS